MTGFRVDFSILLKHVSDYWAKHIRQRDELIRKLFNLVIDISVCGYHKQESQAENKYKIIFSPNYYGYGNPPQYNASQIVSRIVEILKEHGWEVPIIANILIRFKLFLEDYKWEESKDGDKFIIFTIKKDEGIEDFRKKYQYFIDQMQNFIYSEWSHKITIFKKIICFTVFSSIITLVILFLLLIIFIPDLFKFIIQNYVDGIFVWIILLISLAVGISITYFICKKQKK
jgi:hypothetical protein